MPDLNSVPPSPHSLAVSRRHSSSQMPPPPVPTSPSLNILPSNQSAVNHGSSSSLPSPHLPPPSASITSLSGDNNVGVGSGPGPLRHPRPLTAAELHLQLEKEQEAVVNRLTRELSLLRAAQNASVVSNTSSTSAGASGAADPPLVSENTQPLLSGSGFSIPSSAGRQHQRTYSNTSTRSQTAVAGSSGAATSVMGITAPAPTRPSAPSMSRQNSTASRRSRTDSPGPQSLPHSYTHSHMADPAVAGYFQLHRGGPPPPQQQQQQQHNASSVSGATPGGGELSPGIMTATTRYEETAFYRSELESVKRENEALKRRVRELERAVRERRASDASRGRSESVSTTASINLATAAPGSGRVGGAAGIAGHPAGRRERVVSSLSVAGSVGVGVPEDEVRVGESAASAGLRAQEGNVQGAPTGAAAPS